jgi:hypothetical protein
MSAPSPARRVRRRFLSVSLWTSSVAFVVIEGYALLDQVEIGHASIPFMLGTACLAAAACIALFAIISAIGLVVSTWFSDEFHQQQSGHAQEAAAADVARLGHPPAISLAPGRSSSRRHRQPPRSRAVASEDRRAPPQAL